MLEIKEIFKTFNAGTVNEKVALKGLSLTLNEGDFVTVIGGNGAGKSTMLNCVAGVHAVESGEIFIGGTNVTALPEYKRAAFIGRVFQDPMMGTAATMQIEENLALAARRGKKRGLRVGITKAEREEYREQLKILDLGLEDLQSRPAVRWPAPGADPADGYPAQAQAVAAGRAYRSPGPQDRRQSAFHHRADREAEQSDHLDDYP